jgi:hypothetical protein
VTISLSETTEPSLEAQLIVEPFAPETTRVIYFVTEAAVSLTVKPSSKTALTAATTSASYESHNQHYKLMKQYQQYPLKVL